MDKLCPKCQLPISPPDSDSCLHCGYSPKSTGELSDHPDNEIAPAAPALTLTQHSEVQTMLDISPQDTPTIETPNSGLNQGRVVSPPDPGETRAEESVDKSGEMQPGQVINQKYKIVSILGKGGLGVVYKVEHLLLPSKKFFALKVLHPQLSQKPQFRKRFIREVEVAMEFAHEHAVQIRDFGETEEAAQYFTMDFSPGIPLRKLIDKEGGLSEERALTITRQILSALQHAHAKGIVHRDLKPDNILMEERFGSDHALVLDFGIAKVLSDDPDQKITGQALLGTPLYMSPEQASGEGIDNRTDIYALGVILYEMVTGRAPFAGTTREILVAHIVQTPRLPRAINPKISASVETIIDKAMAKDRNARFSSAGEFMAAIDTASTSKERSTRKKNKHWLSALAIAAAIILVAFAWVWMREKATSKKYQDRFEDALREQKFSEAESILVEISGRFSPRAMIVLQKRLDEGRGNYLGFLMEEAKKEMGKGDMEKAFQFLEKAELLQKGSARRQMEEIQSIREAKEAMSRGEWEKATSRLKTAQNFFTQELQVPITLLAELISQCERETKWQALVANGNHLIEKGLWEEALRSFEEARSVRDDPRIAVGITTARTAIEIQDLKQRGTAELVKGRAEKALAFFEKAESIQNQSAENEIYLARLVREGTQALENKDWNNAREKFEAAQEYRAKEFPGLEIPGIAKSLQKCQKEIRSKIEERQKKERVQNEFVALDKALHDRDWPAIPPLIEALGREPLSPEEQQKLNALQKLYPPISLELVTKIRPKEPWQKATTELTGGCFYQLKLQVSQPVYLYGFQQDNSAAIECVFPAYTRGGFKPFDNPVKPGEYSIPPGEKSAFQLDNNSGQEFFYFLYSNFPLKNPEQIVEEHIIGRNKYPMILIKAFDKNSHSE